MDSFSRVEAAHASAAEYSVRVIFVNCGMQLHGIADRPGADVAVDRHRREPSTALRLVESIRLTLKGLRLVLSIPRTFPFSACHLHKYLTHSYLY